MMRKRGADHRGEGDGRVAQHVFPQRVHKGGNFQCPCPTTHEDKDKAHKVIRYAWKSGRHSTNWKHTAQQDRTAFPQNFCNNVKMSWHQSWPWSTGNPLTVVPRSGEQLQWFPSSKRRKNQQQKTIAWSLSRVWAARCWRVSSRMTSWYTSTTTS